MENVVHDAAAEPAGNDGQGRKVFDGPIVPAGDAGTTGQYNGAARRRVVFVLGLEALNLRLESGRIGKILPEQNAWRGEAEQKQGERASPGG